MAGAVSVVPQRPHRTGHSPTLATADRRQEARGVVVGLRRTPGRTNPIRMIGSVLRRHRPHGRTTAGGFDQQESTRETSQRTSGLSFSQVALKNRQLVFVANPHLRLAAFAFEAADRSQPGSLSHRRI